MRVSCVLPCGLAFGQPYSLKPAHPGVSGKAVTHA